MRLVSNAVRLATVLFSGALVGCGVKSDSSKHLHPQILHLRVMLEHGSTVDEFRTTLEAARLDFETRKTDFDSDRQRKIDSALSSAEQMMAFEAETPGMSASTLHNGCSRFVQIHAYRAVKDCDKEVAEYQDLDPSNSSQSLQLYRLLQEKNDLVIELVEARIRHAVLSQMKAAETATI